MDLVFFSKLQIFVNGGWIERECREKWEQLVFDLGFLFWVSKRVEKIMGNKYIVPQLNTQKTPQLIRPFNEVKLELYFQIFVEEKVHIAELFPQDFQNYFFIWWCLRPIIYERDMLFLLVLQFARLSHSFYSTLKIRFYDIFCWRYSLSLLSPPHACDFHT